MRSKPDGDGWFTVNRRKHKDERVNWGNRKDVTSFFVENLPPGVSPSQIKMMFKNFGWLIDVYVANKQNRNGKFFAFVRFKDVQDVKKLEESMNGLKLRSNNLRVNLAKFTDRNPNQRPLVSGLIPPTKKAANNINVNSGVRDGRSFAQATAGAFPPPPPSPKHYSKCPPEDEQDLA